MSILDDIFKYTTTLEINDYPIVAQQQSRNRVITTVQASPRVWKFKANVTTWALQWGDYRGLIEDIRSINTSQPFSFDVANIPNLHPLISYQGTLTAGELASVVTAARPANSAPNVLAVSGLPANRGLVFRKGDYIQVGNAVRTITADVNSSALGTATLTLSEALVSYPPTNTRIVAGANVVWNNCYFTDLPVPSMGSEYMAGIIWSGSFSFTQSLS